MKKVYLASDSQARRKLFDFFGLKFKVIPAKIKENKNIGNLSYAALVKNNALDKAKDVARRVKEGVIIGADTIVVQDKKIFGKPKDLKEARLMLRRLSGKPQWLYTGIAVIDKPPHQLVYSKVDFPNWCGGKDKQKVMLASEKTKVYMDKLTDKEIENYFAYISPLDKAGGFDIQGKGAFFIRRIEGCFYNAAGLPLRKLYLMFKEMGIKIFLPRRFKTAPLEAGRMESVGIQPRRNKKKSNLGLRPGWAAFMFCIFNLTLCIFLSGCSTEYDIATGKEETFYYSTDKEVQMGQAISQQVEKEYKAADDPLIQKRVEDIGKKIASVCDRKEIDYSFKVLNDEEVNAFSLPGGFVYVNKGLIDKVSNDDELAAVLAHEVGHVVARHSIKKLQAMQAYSILRILVAAAPGSGNVGNAADIAFAEILLGYGREDELLADQLGARYTKLAGYNPRAMISFLEKLQDIERRKPARPKSYFKTHPYVPDRIRIVKQELGEKISFTDYINIEQTKHK